MNTKRMFENERTTPLCLSIGAIRSLCSGRIIRVTEDYFNLGTCTHQE